MAILAFQKPDKVIMLEADDRYGKFEFRPLEPGYGITVGNALRRILLSSLEGYAITNIKIDGVEHEFSTITGVIEDLTEIILNLKQVPVRLHSEEPKVLSLDVSGPGRVTAGQLDRQLPAPHQRPQLLQRRLHVGRPLLHRPPHHAE